MELFQQIFDFIEKFKLPGAVGIAAISAMTPSVPMLPSATINYKNFGTLGILSTYLGYIIGSLIAFSLVVKISKKFKFIENFFENNKSAIKLKSLVQNKGSIFVLLALIIPITPTSLVIYVCAMSEMNKVKFIRLILISGIFTALVSSAIGVSLIKFMKKPTHVLALAIIATIGYFLVKKIGEKYLNSIKE